MGMLYNVRLYVCTTLLHVHVCTVDDGLTSSLKCPLISRVYKCRKIPTFQW